MYISHLGSLKIKTSRNVHDVRKLVQCAASVPYPIWQGFRSRKMMKIGGWVYNMCYCNFIVEISEYDPQRPNQGPWRRTFVFGSMIAQGSLHQWLVIKGPCSNRRGFSCLCLWTFIIFIQVLFWEVFELNDGPTGLLAHGPSIDTQDVEGMSLVSELFCCSF